MRFDNNNFRSLNESINYVQNPHRELAEALEYTATLESVILSICEELEIDPDDLVEMAMTATRDREFGKKFDRIDRKKRKLNPNGHPVILGKAIAPYKKLDREEDKIRKRYNREWSSTKKLYGKGGKVLKRKRDIGGHG